ncbi:MAG: PepSY domain-containing protein, partial [Candidatus Eremiobacteraeota bacterium]|nr:PepSY domain-containing protein [Candidatus Eremiobacteraeota bacterium]
MKFKAYCRVVHRWLGLVGALIILLVCASGALLAFHMQLEDWLDRALRQASGPSQVSPAVALAAAQALARPGEQATRFYLPEHPGQNYKVRLQQGPDRRHLYVDASTGQPVGEGTELISGLINFHRRLLLGETGRYITTLGALFFLTSQWSGLLLALPRKLRGWKQALTISNKSQARLLYDLHRTLGVYALVFLTLLGCSGLLMSPFEDRLESWLYRLAGRQAAPRPTSGPGQHPVGLDQAISQAQTVFPSAQVLAVNLPRKPKDAYQVALRHPGQPGPVPRSFVYVDQFSGQVLASQNALERTGVD